MTTYCDVAIVGGGMAGCALAANLAGTVRAVVFEREAQPGYHATGRSAAAFSQIYGSSAIRALTRASRDFFFAAPPEFAPAGLLEPRGVLYLARTDQIPALQAFEQIHDVAACVRRVAPAQARAWVPCLRADYVAAALHESAAGDLDVHALQQGYLRQFRAQGGALVTQADVTAIERTSHGWELETTRGRYAAALLVDAAGAWADQIARLAGIAPLGLQPLRRTACTVDLPPDLSCARWPLTVDIGGEFYFKPDAGRLLLSPADEIASPPCDAWPEDTDVAVAVDRLERVTSLSVTRVHHAWAGLRSFFPDRDPAIGFDGRVADFFWLAGLGGYGIQTAPAVGRLAAALLQRRPPPQDVLDQGLRLADIAPQRLLRTAAHVCAISIPPESAT